MSYNLTDRQKELLKWLVEQVQAGVLSEEFAVRWKGHDGELSGFKGGHPTITKGSLEALASADMLLCTPNVTTTTFQIPGRITPDAKTVQKEDSRRCTITGTAYQAADSDFAPDESFVTHLTPLADVSNLDSEIKDRCLPPLSAGSADPKMWDNAVRTAGVILEERLRDIGGITEAGARGKDLVSKVFGKKGTLAGKFKLDSERESYRDLYAGAVGTLRNPFAHRLIDPQPEDGGALIVFVNLLLKMLEDLHQ